MADPASTHSNEQPAGQAASDVVILSGQDRQELATRKITCPFLGPAVVSEQLAVRQDRARPLASIEDVRALGNTGGGDLGDVLVVFAQGNHAFMLGPSGVLDQPVPSGLFSLDLPGSQGSHPGHSGILQGDPSVVDSGRFSESDFNRLLSRARNGLITRSDVGAFIRENVERDPEATKFSLRSSLKSVFSTLVEGVPAGFDEVRHALSGTPEVGAQRQALEALTSNARASNVVGSAGEFGLLFAFLERKPGAVTVDGEPTVSVEDLTLMFQRRQFPEGWETWPKARASWVRNTLALAQSAVTAHRQSDTAS
jgi:hypothetical protein